MIYVISDSELQALVACAGYECKAISPLFDYVDATKINYGKTFEERADNLRNLGLMSFDSKENYMLTAEGALMLKVLLQPDCVASIGKKKCGNELIYAMKREGIWYVMTHLAERKMFMVGAYFTTETLAKWLDEQFLNGYVPDKPVSEKLDVTLSCEEWYMFLASQFVFDKREKQDKLAEPNEFFTMNEMFESKAFVFIKNALEELSSEESNDAIDMFFAEDALQKADEVKNSLALKGIFTLFEAADGREVLSYSDSAVAWLDNDFLIDTVFFNFKKDDGEYTVLFSIRRTGITSIFDRGSELRIASSHQIPWEFYMR